MATPTATPTPPLRERTPAQVSIRVIVPILAPFVVQTSETNTKPTTS
jgi:hypothetical protein